MATIPHLKALGERGSWFATVDGERLPCVHKYWIKGLHHHAKRAWINDPREAELFNAILSTGKVIVTKSEVTGDGEAFRRTGYIAVYRVENATWRDNEMRFDLVEKLATLKNE